MIIRWVSGGVFFSALAFSQDRDLDRGRAELRGFAGVSFGPSSGLMDTVAPTAGAEIAFGLNRLLAVTGSCANNSLGMHSARRHEVMGGVRISAANRSRVTPYGALTAGAVTASVSGRTSAMGGSTDMMGATAIAGGSIARFGVSPGGGIDCKIGRNVGVFLDFRAVKAVDIEWYGRTAAGVYLRWN
ncbi:MAG: hypothetical protein KJZ84_23270 [Bryobacteraceae bacterium]|nr:hypothetical protein [Bryobacteraceae bacterium]